MVAINVSVTTITHVHGERDMRYSIVWELHECPIPTHLPTPHLPHTHFLVVKLQYGFVKKKKLITSCREYVKKLRDAFHES
jgi:hypothetical protein